MNPLVSIIVPVYNAERYLHRCVDSLLAQTYQNIEIILVDDGSTDGSAAICDEYGKDARVRAVHQENQGASAARNAGLDTMRGEYVMFVDSDDYVSPEFVQKPMEIIECPRGGDIVCFPYYEDRQGDLRLIRNECFNFPSLTKREAQKMMLRKEIDAIMWNKIYCSALWRQIRFPSGMSCEDVLITPSIFEQIREIRFLDMPLYYYNKSNASSVSQTGGVWFQYCLVQGFVEYEKTAQQLGEKEILKEIRIDNLQRAIRLQYKNYFYHVLPAQPCATLQAYLHEPWVQGILPFCHFHLRIEYWLMGHCNLLARQYGKLRYGAKEWKAKWRQGKHPEK